MNADIKKLIGEATAYDKKQMLEISVLKVGSKVYRLLPMARVAR